MAITSPYWPTGKCGKATITLSKLSITRGTSPTGSRKYLPPSRPQKYFRRRAFLDGAIPCDDEPSQSRAPDRHRAPDQHRNGEGLPSLDALKDLQSKGKVLAGGHPVGQHDV